MCSTCGKKKCCCPTTIRGQQGPAGPRGPKGDTGVLSATEVSGTSDQTINSSIPAVISGTSQSLAAGIYAVTFAGSYHTIENNTIGTYGIYANGILHGVLNTLGRSADNVSSNHLSMAHTALITLASAGTIDVRGAASAGSYVVEKYTVVALKIS